MIKTKLVQKIGEFNLEKRVVVNPPYTVYGHSTLLPSFSMSMKVGGLRKMLVGLADEDSFGITVSDKMTEYTIVKKLKTGAKSSANSAHNKPHAGSFGGRE